MKPEKDFYYNNTDDNFTLSHRKTHEQRLKIINDPVIKKIYQSLVGGEDINKNYYCSSKENLNPEEQTSLIKYITAVNYYLFDSGKVNRPTKTVIEEFLEGRTFKEIN